MLYGGDEIGALVFDIGHHSLRVGYGQEATPMVDIPAQVGFTDKCEPLPPPNCDNYNLDAEEKKLDPSNITTSKRRYFIDTMNMNVPRRDVDVTTYMKDGMIDDWDLFEKVLDYTYSDVLRVESQYQPALMSEAPWNLRSKREKLMELMFEKYNVPAFHLAKNAALAAYASGRTTAVIVDSGATHTTAVPIHDGFVLSHAIVKSPLGGDYITMQCKQYLTENDIDISPPYMIASKDVVKERDKPKWVKKTNLPEVTPSWHSYMTKSVVQDFQKSVLQVAENPYDEKQVATYPAVHYEFPNGYHQDFGCESAMDQPVRIQPILIYTFLELFHVRESSQKPEQELLRDFERKFRIPEALFDPSTVQMDGMVGNAMLGVAHIVTTSVGMCDVDIRPALYSSVIVTGGNSILQGFQERLNRDLSVRVPGSMRLKVNACSGAAERRFGAWIGGSILASIVGSLHHFWITAQEYEEGGKAYLERKCQ